MRVGFIHLFGKGGAAPALSESGTGGLGAAGGPGSPARRAAATGRGGSRDALCGGPGPPRRLGAAASRLYGNGRQRPPRSASVLPPPLFVPAPGPHLCGSARPGHPPPADGRGARRGAGRSRRAPLAPPGRCCPPAAARPRLRAGGAARARPGAERGDWLPARPRRVLPGAGGAAARARLGGRLRGRAPPPAAPCRAAARGRREAAAAPPLGGGTGREGEQKRGRKEGGVPRQ